MSKDYVISGELKYFRLENTMGYYEIIQGKKKDQTALDFLRDVKTTLGYNTEIRSKVKGKTLKDVVDTVVTGCDTKNIGFLQRIWTAFQRFLVSLGFTSFTPEIDLIHSEADKIRQDARFLSFSEFSSSGYSLFFFQTQVKAIIAFFKQLSPDQAAFFGRGLQALLNEDNLTTIKECTDRAEALYAHYSMYQELHEVYNPYDIVTDRGKAAGPLFSIKQLRVAEFDNVFTILAKEEYENGNYGIAASYLAKVFYVRDISFIPNLIEKCLGANRGHSAAEALSKIYYSDKWRLELQIGLHLIHEEEMCEDDIELVLELAERTKFSDEDSTLAKELIARCLKDKKYYPQAIKATDHFHFFREDTDRFFTQAAEALVNIATSCLEQSDLATALEAYKKIQHGKRPLELQKKLVDACLKANSIESAHGVAVEIEDEKIMTDLLHQIVLRCLTFYQYANAANSVSWMSREDMQPEYFTTVETVFRHCFEFQLDQEALAIARYINDREWVCENLFKIANRRPLSAESAMRLINNPKYFTGRDLLLREIKAREAAESANI